jgi:hypothetical protein
MSKPHSLALIALMGLSLTAVSSYGDMFDYSITLPQSGDKITGTLQGTVDGQYVDYVTNVTLSIGGVADSGPITTYHDNTDYSASILGSPVVSFIAANNNFTFEGTTETFEMGGLYGGYVEVFSPNLPSSSILGGAHGEWDDYGNFPGSTWSLTDVTPTSSSVPDGGLSIALFGMALSGLAFIRRRL